MWNSVKFWCGLSLGIGVGWFLPQLSLVDKDSWQIMAERQQLQTVVYLGVDPNLSGNWLMSSGGDRSGRSVAAVTYRTKAEMDAELNKLLKR